MANKRIKKKRQRQNELAQISQLIEKASPFIENEDLRELSKLAKKSVPNRQTVFSQFSSISEYVSDQQEKVDYFRSLGAQWKYGKVKFHNTLENMDKYRLIKKYWDLVKQGHIKYDSSLTYYDDVADWALENMSNEKLQEVIAEGEERKAKRSIREAQNLSKLVEF